jgi:hypothetical protein
MELTKLAISKNPTSVTCGDNMLVIVKVTGIKARQASIDHQQLVYIINDLARKNHWQKGEEIKKFGPFTLPVEFISFRSKDGKILTIIPDLKELNYQNVAGIHHYEITAEVNLN